jgi:hypothetical protein
MARDEIWTHDNSLLSNATCSVVRLSYERNVEGYWRAKVPAEANSG